MLIGENMKKISTKKSYHQEKLSEKVSTSGNGNYCVRNGKIHSTKPKMVSN